MAFSKETKSNRLLQSRRFTQDALGDAQEAFTRVLDLNASEIYSQQNLIPTSSLPYSGSSQNGETVIVDGEEVLKFWYRHRLTPSDTRNAGESSYNTWFFLDPTSSAEFSNGVNPGVLSSKQQGSFISPKYAPTLGGNAEDSTPGYQVKLTRAGTIVDPASYTFDYKTGVLQFNAQSGYTSISTDIRLTAYQYTGKTLASDATTGYSGSFSGSFEGSADLNSLTVTGDSNLTGNTDRTGTLVQDGNLTLTGSFNQDGNISQIGDATLTGNTDRTGTLIQNGNLTLTGSLNQDGNINQIGDATLTGNTDRTGTLTQNGNLTLTGSFNQNGNINQIGDATLTGNTDRTGTLIQDGNLTLTGSFNHSGSYNLIGDINQTGSVFQSGSLDVNGPIFSQGTNVIDNAVALAIALG